MRHVPETGQVAQRVRVGLTGLAVVLLLIVLASAVLRSVSRERPVALPGASRSDVVANIAATNDADPAGEPLAEIGVAPAGQGNAAAPVTPAPAPTEGRR